ncbi:MAG TPA: PFL family protein [Alphaproteobacteria bacterium]|nr:PFL family protein [Alphaproteobacteria bacterium]
MKHLSFSGEEIIETIQMVRMEQLDIRTVTVGISLLDCVSDDPKVLTRNVFEKVTNTARDLRRVCAEISREFGIPIVNCRIAVTPLSLISGRFGPDQFLELAATLDRAAHDVDVDFIGGFSALVEKGTTPAESHLIGTIPRALASTQRVCASVNVGTTRAGLNMDAIAQMGSIVKETAELTAKQDSIGCAKLVVFCNAVQDNPFMAGAFHGASEGDCVINVGVSGPGVVLKTIKAAGDVDFGQLTASIRQTAFKITRAGELVGRTAAARLGIPFGIVDLSLAPTPSEGDSVARILEEIGLERVGGHGTTAALALLNDAVKKGGAMASSHVGGLSGAFIPVSEDIGMIEAAECGAITIDKLEAMTSVCSVGLDMIVVPGDTPPEILSAVISDEAAIGMINNKTTATRIIPAIGKSVGDQVNFGGLLGRAPVMPLNQSSPRRMIARGGRIPSPLGALTN